MTVLNLDCRHGLAMLPDNSVDAILTDPPYEIGFMGQAWDRSGIAFDVDMWRQALRVLKPGGFLLSFSGSRTYHRIASAIEDAGFEIRDSIMWVYGSGFPKSLDIAKAIDKLYGATSATLAAQLWDGWGTGLKPAHEPICVARKAIDAATVAANVLRWGVGGINIDGCRVPIDPVADASQLRTMRVSQHHGADGWGMNTAQANPAARVLGTEGRWPSNFIHDGSPEVLALFPDASGAKAPVKGIEPTANGFSGATCYGGMQARVAGPEPRGDSGSAARFYQQCDWSQDDLEAALFFYCAKASRSEKEAGLDSLPTMPAGVGDNRPSGSFNERLGKGTVAPRKNTHPTVKPVTLGRYLARLICPPGGMLVDLFAGSGSFGVAAKQEGFQFLGFELDPSHCDISNSRLMSSAVTTFPANLAA